MHYANSLCLVGIALTATLITAPLAAEEPPSIALTAFKILNRSCFECHGASRQEGGLRLDTWAALRAGGDSGAVIDAGSADQSELLRRISLPQGHSEVMPNRGKVLSAEDQFLLKQWIAEGTPWPEISSTVRHWSYVAPQKAELAAPSSVGKAETTGNPVDQFVEQRLKAAGMNCAPCAPPHVLARRLYLDTIGLPPTPSEADAFAAAANQNMQRAVEDLVDQLLLLPQYGEKWATPWLDAARYADSHGFQRDDLRELWAYRDWVIQSLNDDMPFDQFSIEQLAGDLLPNPTQSQLIATGFNRCAPCNVEAGTDPNENRYNQVVDRVNTLGYVWLGTTLECAQCHDHKYDPFTMRDYYGLFAFFNQTELEADRSNPQVPGSIKFIGPYMDLTNEEDQRRLSQLSAKISALRDQLTALAEPNTASTEQLTTNQAVVGQAAPPSPARKVLKPIDFASIEGSSHEVKEDHSIVLAGDPPELDTYTATFEVEPGEMVGLLLEALTDASLPGEGPGRGDAKRPNFVLNSFEVYGTDLISATSTSEASSLLLTDALADFSQKNFDVAGAIDKDPKSAWAINPKFGQPHWAAFRFAMPQQLDGVKRLTVRMVQNHGGARTIGRFRISGLYGDYSKAVPKTDKESPQVMELKKQLVALERQRDSIAIPKTLVMRELKEPRQSTMYLRGDFRAVGETVRPSTPAVLHPLLGDEPMNRLALARWLVSPENPLVGRVVVNRIWSEIFGLGLVATPEDFGLKGELPSHPELLDWLAVDFVERGWSQKKLLRTILTSQTYRQASVVTPTVRELDPTNRWLGRGPRFRMTAEGIRDNALAIAGVLERTQYGPPIRPPQPDGLWTKVGGEKYDYAVSPGAESLRRGVYVVLKRMSPYPSFINFDATPRLACRVKRNRSNTPLQALNLLNDPVYVDAAKSLALRVTSERQNAGLDQQLEYAFRLAVARRPAAAELDRLKKLFSDELAASQASQSSPTTESAWFAVSLALLNLDETITKE